jgi:hypothetical protein
VALAMAMTWLALGFHGGREYLFSARVLAAFRRELYWALPACAAFACFLRVLYALALARRDHGLAVVYGIPRAFALFPLYAWICVWAMLGGMLETARRWLSSRREGGPPPSLESIIEWRLGVVVWYAFLPFIAAGRQVEGGAVPVAAATRPMLLRLLTVFLLVLILTEESPNPFKLSAVLAFAFTDYITAARRVAPAIAEQALAAKAAAQ